MFSRSPGKAWDNVYFQFTAACEFPLLPTKLILPEQSNFVINFHVDTELVEHKKIFFIYLKKNLKSRI